MSEWTIARIRAALVRTDEGLGRPYPEQARRAALAWVDAQQRGGMGHDAAARELGISPTTLRAWRRGTAEGSFCAVEIVTPSVKGESVVVHAPGGLRIAGLSVAEIAELSRRLA